MLNRSSNFEKFLFRRGGKYLVVGLSISAVHTLYLIFFYMISIFPMLFFNLFSIAGYLFFSAEAYRGNKIKEFFMFAVTELPLHAILASLFLGWSYQFMIIMIASIPIIFYFILFINQFKHVVLIPTIISVFYIVFYFAIKIHLQYNEPFVTNIRNAEKYETFYSSFNTILVAASVMVFNILTAFEYNYVKNKLVSENSKLDTYATYDPLTNLLNRRSTDAALEHLYDIHYHDEDSFSIIMCDIDKFKSVNDTYGHDAGDFVLKEVAWIIKDQVRDGDVVGRWGGEEFLIVVNGNRNSASILAERIRSNVEKHIYTYKSLELKVTITLGVSSFHANSDIKALIKSADTKLYRGKENGRNQVVS